METLGTLLEWDIQLLEWRYLMGQRGSNPQTNKKILMMGAFWPCRHFCWLETTASTHDQRQFHSLYSVWRNPCPTLYTSWILWDICRIKIRSQVNRVPKTEEDWGCRLISSPWFRVDIMKKAAVADAYIVSCKIGCEWVLCAFKIGFFLTRWYGISVFFTRPLIMDFMSTFCLLLKIFCGVLDG